MILICGANVMIQLWSKPLFNGDLAVVLFNANNVDELNVTVTWDQV